MSGYSPFTSVAFSPDGSDLLVAGSDVVLLNPRDGSARQILEERASAPSTAASFSSDGQYIVTGHTWEIVNRSASAVVWNRLSGDVIRRFPGHHGVIRQVAFASNDQIVVTSSDDGIIHFFEVTTGEEMGRITRESAYRHALPFAVSPTEEILAVMRIDLRPVRLEFYEIPSGNLYDLFVQGVEGIPSESPAITYSRDGQLIIGTHYVIDAADGTYLYNMLGEVAGAVDITDDGRAVAVGGVFGTVAVWCLTDETVIADWCMH